MIRCQAGINRSGLVVALLLMRDGMSAEDAINLIRKKRSEWALSNDHFNQYIRNWKAES